MAQSFGVKLNNPKDIIIRPAKTVQADSIYIQQTMQHEMAFEVMYSLYFDKKILIDGVTIILWQGTEYDKNKDYTRQEIKARLKQLLTQ
jgi:hypothetical protein